jgi:hypothetical protein
VPLAAQNLFEIEDEFHENMNEILERFYNRYQNVFKYISGFNRFLGDMTSGYFIQYTVDGCYWTRTASSWWWRPSTSWV